MKLHLPHLFRKALLACLAGLVAPAVTLASGSLAADPSPLTPTLDRLHADDPDAYPNGSAYSLTEGEQESDGTITLYTYELQADGSYLAVPHYYQLATRTVNSTGIKLEDKGYDWTTDSPGKQQLTKADSFGGNIVYKSGIIYNKHANALTPNVDYKQGEIVFGSGSGKKEFYWTKEDFGKYEAFHDGTDNYHEWKDGVGPWVDSGKNLHYEESFDEFGMPTVGRGDSEYRWSLKNGSATNGLRIVFRYDDSDPNSSRLENTSGGTISGTYVDLKHEDEDAKWKKEFGDLSQSNKGGAVKNEVAITGNIEADFVGNEAISHINVQPNDGANIMWNGGANIANEALGGALYNAGSVSGSIEGGFVGNMAQSAIIMEATICPESSSRELNLVSKALGGAIYNNGHISGEISGDFISNSAYVIHWPKKGVLSTNSFFPTENITLSAKGGAIYNTSRVDKGIKGNFIGNNAISQLTMAPRGSASYTDVNGMYTAAGGAIYNGMEGEVGNIGSVTEIVFRTGDISGNFVGNYAYNYHFTQQDGMHLVGQEATITTYAAGGAIFNGIERFEAGSDSLTKASSEVGKITGIFIDNYVYDVNPFVCGEYFFTGNDPKTGKPYTDDDKQKDYKHWQLGDQFTNKLYQAVGGAIYNGVYGDGSDIELGLSSSIASIGDEIDKGEFVGNYAYVKTYATNHASTQYTDDKSIFAIYASGGAIYNGIRDISINGEGGVQSVITDGIYADFTGNYAYTYRSLGYADNNQADGRTDHSTNGRFAPSGFSFVYENIYASGGAIYNGVANVGIISAEEDAVKSYIGKISGNFAENYVSVEETSAWATSYAIGGAIYNGVHYTNFGKEVINGNVASTIGRIETAYFVGNEVYNYLFTWADRSPNNKKAYALGGAIYNGVIGIVGNDRHTEGSVTSLINFIGSSEADGKPSVIFESNKARTYNEKYGSNANTMSHYAFGGAIYNGIERIGGNSADAEISVSIPHITADFSGNGTETEAKIAGAYYAFGGAIYNGIGHADNVSGEATASIGTIQGIFDDNHAVSSTYSSAINSARGGAIYNGIDFATENEGEIKSTIGKITAFFHDNYAYSKCGEAFGGAIYNGNRSTTGNVPNLSAKIETIIGDFIGNYAQSSSNGDANPAVGGAIYNFGEIGTITGDFINNKTDASNNALGGAIVNGEGIYEGLIIANTDCESRIASIEGLFINNRAMGGKASGGAILNGMQFFGYSYENYNLINDNSGGKFSLSISSIKSGFEGNQATASNGNAFGGAIGNGMYGYGSNGKLINSEGEIIFSITSIKGGDFVSNTASATAYAFGGAVANGIGSFSPSGAIDNSGGTISMSIGSINSDFVGNRIDTTKVSTSERGARGGALFNGFGTIGFGSKGIINTSGVIEARIDAISGDFINNEAHSIGRKNASNPVDDAYASGSSGGAIYNGIGTPSSYYASGNIRNFTNTNGRFSTHIGEISGNFKGNAAVRDKDETGLPNYVYVNGHAYGGAIFNGIGSIVYSNTNISNIDGEISATIDSIKGDFKENYVKDDTSEGRTSGRAYGGAIFNGICFTSGTNNVGGTIEARIGTITGEFRGNMATATSGTALGGAIYNSGTIGDFEDDYTAEGAHDGTVSGGVLNSSFYDNEASGKEAHGGGIWTSGRLAIVADGEVSAFTGNKAGGESSGLYISGADTAVYLISRQNGHIRFDDIIEGTLSGKNMDEGKMSTLRLRGYTSADDSDSGKGGAVTFNNLVKHTDILMDDVTLYLGVKENDEETKKGEVGTSDKTLEGPEFRGDYWVQYVSHILEESNLTTQTGTVNTVDGLATNYRINKLVTTGKRDVDEGERYASYAIDILPEKPGADARVNDVRADDGRVIRAKVEKSDVFTVGNGSKGYVTLTQLSVQGLWDQLGGPEDGTNQDDDDRIWGYWPGDRGEKGFNNYDHLYVQVINYVGDDYAGMREDEKFAIQLDLSDLVVADYERSHMHSRDVLAKGIDYVSVKTYHDGVHLLGWRDPLAAWAEFGEDATWEDGDKEYKSFHIYGGHTQTLTRNLNIMNDDDKRTDKVGDNTSPLMTGTDLRIIGEGNDSVLNVNNKNMLTQIGAKQSVRLQNLRLLDDSVKNNTTLNEGNLILDTLIAYEQYNEAEDKPVKWRVDNQASGDKKLTVTGDTQINYTITTTGGRYGEMLIDNSTKVNKEGKSTIYIRNEVSNQNIVHNEVAPAQQTRDGDEGGKWSVGELPEPQEGDLPIIYEFDGSKYKTETHLYTTKDKDSDEATEAFKKFKNNSLDMQDGIFYLHDMSTFRLVLRGLNINHGSIHVDTAKVDLQNRVMGGIDTVDRRNSVEDGATGAIWLGEFKIMNDASRLVTHVKFVDTEVGRVVRDGFGLAQNPGKSITMQGSKYQYQVSYANKTDVDTTAAADKRGKADPYNHIVSSGDYGYYTFVRSGMSTRLNPGPVAQQAAVFPMIQMVFDYAFHHADLYADCMAPPAPSAPGGFEVVTPVKGKEYAGLAAVPTAALAGDMAADYAAAERSVAYRGGMWLRPYMSFENIPLHDGPKVDATLYGALVGFDTPVTDYTNGWASVFTGYLGYNGSRLRWDGYRTTTNGGLVGVTETFYKRHFYTALTANIGFTAGDTHSVYGSEDYNMYTLGVAWRTGYNIELAQGKYVIQPAVQLSYTLGMVDSYTNAEGVRMKASPMHAFQVSPMLKVIKHTESEWKPYLTGAVVWTLAGETKFKAEGDKLPGMSLRPYVEYGLGIQKTWADKYTIYGQVTGHSLGRQGVEVSGGIRWAW